MNKPKIVYPCEWCYTVIGSSEGELRDAAQQVFCGKEYSIALSKRSKGGKYISMAITTNVEGEEERNTIFKKLSEHAAIKIVI
jgi:uncharacterized protein